MKSNPMKRNFGIGSPAKKLLDEVTVSAKKKDTRRPMTKEELSSRKVNPAPDTKYFIDKKGTVSTTTTKKK